MMNAAGKTTAALALAAALLLPSQASAETLAITTQGLQEFVQRLPSDDILYTGIQQALATCEACGESQEERSLALASFMERTLDHAGYDYGASLIAYVDTAMSLAREPAADPALPGVVQWSGVDHFFTPAVALLQEGAGHRLVSAGILEQAEVNLAWAIMQ